VTPTSRLNWAEMLHATQMLRRLKLLLVPESERFNRACSSLADDHRLRPDTPPSPTIPRLRQRVHPLIDG